jgi:hypothetical protein
MAAINNYGLNYSDKNRVRRYHEQGTPVQQIASHLRCTVELVGRYIRTLSKSEAVEPGAVPVAKVDKFGPLPDSPEWADLTPSQKGQISKRRNAA